MNFTIGVATVWDGAPNTRFSCSVLLWCQAAGRHTLDGPSPTKCAAQLAEIRDKLIARGQWNDRTASRGRVSIRFQQVLPSVHIAQAR